MKKPTIINVISGKGGTGKSLITAVLGRLIAQEGASVLLVDLDLFVRGLTHFFYLYKKERRKITHDLTVAGYFGISKSVRKSVQFAFERFYEVDLLPAVSEIEEILNYKEDDLVNYKMSEFFQKLRSTKYDFIIVDNRAGVDDIILSSCKISDISISVSEADPVSRTTNDNLLRHLKKSVNTKVYTIFNKVRYIRTLDDYTDIIAEIRSDYEIAGKIPFDVDLFERFGNQDFWEEINSTKFTYGLAELWNKISAREEFEYKINLKRFPEHRIWRLTKSSSVFANKFERLSIGIGIIFIIAYFLYDSVISGKFGVKDLMLIYAIILFLVPIFRRLFKDK